MGGPDLFAFLLMLLMTISGGTANNDLLDLIPTPAYWRAKEVTITLDQLLADTKVGSAPGDAMKLARDLESLSRREAAKKQLAAMGADALEALRSMENSDDPEAAQMARDLIRQVGTTGKAADIRRLMAIRTLGERKEPSAVARLKELAESKEMFVADYASRALAMIEGKAIKPVDHRFDLNADLAMLPANTGTIAQTIGAGTPGLSLDTLIDLMARNPEPADEAEKVKLKEEMARVKSDMVTRLIAYAEQVGNVRADGATFALSADIGGTNEWFAVSVRGQFDRKAVAEFVTSISRNKAPTEMRGNVLVVPFAREAMVALPSDTHFILASSNPANTPLNTVIDPMLDAISGVRPGTLAENKELAALLKGLDKSGPVWAASIPSARMKREPFFAPFNTLTLATADDGKNITVTVKSSPSQDPQPAIRELENLRANMLPRLKQAAEQIKDMQPLIAGIESVKFETDEKTGITAATGTIKREIAPIILLTLSQAFRIAPRPMPAPRPAINELPR